MHTSRRQAIRLGFCATAALIAMHGLAEAEPQAAPPAPPAPPQGADSSAWLRRDLFEAHRREWFTVRTDADVVPLRLLGVDEHTRARRTGTVGDANNFVLVFRGPRTPKLTQGTYQVDSRTLGTFELFLVPGWTMAAGTVYTATFSRLA